MGLDAPTLEAVAAAGYVGVETVDVPGDDPVEARRVLADLDLAVTSSHTWADLADPESFARAAVAIAEMGSRRIIVSPRVTETVEGVGATIDRVGLAADIARSHGLRLGYHNHTAEMAEIKGSLIIDRLAAGLGNVDFQVDIFWVHVGGAEPASVIAGLGGRVVSLHVKDGVGLPSSAYGEEPFVNVPVGTGVVDPSPAIEAAKALPSVEWLIVEFDHVEGSAIEAVRASLVNLTTRGLARSRTT